MSNTGEAKTIGKKTSKDPKVVKEKSSDSKKIDIKALREVPKEVQGVMKTPPEKSQVPEVSKTLSGKSFKKDSKVFGWHSEATQKFVYSDKFIQELILSEKNEVFRPPPMKARLKIVLPDDVREKAIKKDGERQAIRKQNEAKEPKKC